MNSAGSKLSYRREIDGLRAIAVLAVILFHADLEPFSGGFVGVDIFFVISGYLITSIIKSELESGEFSIVKFYERRARRILPALFFMLVCCLPFAIAWLLPEDLISFGKSLLSVSTFSSNFYFLNSTDYFSPAAEEQPLLHTWSLAVEEQYYVLFPLLLIFLWRRMRARIPEMILLIATLSLLASELSWRSGNSEMNFYLLHTRAWELLAGSLLALTPGSPLQSLRKWSGALAMLGLAMILYGIFMLDGSTPSPSLQIMPPVLGTVLVLAYAQQTNLAGRLLGSPLLVGIGLISYSAYLWHQPLFAFARITLDHHASYLIMLLLSALSLLIGYASWKYIETPFRKARHSRQRILTASGIGLASVALLGFASTYDQGLKQRFEVPDSVLASITRADAPCFDKIGQHAQGNVICSIDGGDPGTPDYLVLGDSHMYALLPAFRAAEQASGAIGGYAGYSGCPPLLLIHALRKDQQKKDCHALNRRVFEYVRDNHVKTVFLVARWAFYTNGDYHGSSPSYLALRQNDEKSLAISRTALIAGLQETVRRYAGINTRVVIINQIPQQLGPARDIYYRAFATDTPAATLSRLSVPREMHESLLTHARSAFAGLRQSDQLQVIDLTSRLCDAQHCLVGHEDRSFYFDDDHLSVTGALRLTKDVQALLARQ